MKRIFLVPLTAACAMPMVIFAQSSGQQTYDQVCSSCHASGTSGAPVFGDKGAWQSRISKGKQALYDSAINGIGTMPPKRGSPDLSDKDVQAAVDYMVAEVSGGGGQSKSSGGGGQQKAKSSGSSMPSAEELVKAPVSEQQIIVAPDAIKNPLEGDKQAIATGETLFNAMNCSGCHAPEAGGGMGPALTDTTWVYGDQPADIYLTISNGRPNGMPSYGHTLPAEQIWQLVTYIETLE
ncbi:MAG: c-type cytochrome [Gammaproteobacteria bacterium]